LVDFVGTLVDVVGETGFWGCFCVWVSIFSCWYLCFFM